MQDYSSGGDFAVSSSAKKDEACASDSSSDDDSSEDVGVDTSIRTLGVHNYLCQRQSAAIHSTSVGFPFFFFFFF
jgi:hypothetical protein